MSRSSEIESPVTLEARLQAEALRLGFSLFGIAPAAEADGFARFERWVARGFAGEMHYLARDPDLRRHPAAVFLPVQSVVMLGLEYGGVEGPVARYAQGPDYHKHIWERLERLGTWLQAARPDAHFRGVTDSAPLLERDFARRAGLGWFGKNTMLIHKRRGSFFFLAALLTDQALSPSKPHEASHCGTCTACLDACPTDAFPEPGVLDARRCISYLTIELRGPIPLELRPAVGGWLFGCDVCQTVCPWNRRADDRDVPFPHDPSLAALDPLEIVALSDEEFRNRFRGTSLWRAKRSGLVRNAAVVLGNTAGPEAIPRLEAAARDDDPTVRDAALWALERLRTRIDERSILVQQSQAMPARPDRGDS